MQRPFSDGPDGPPTLLAPGFRVDRCDYSPADLLLRLSLRIALVRPLRAPTLLIEHASCHHAFLPLLSCTGRSSAIELEERLWRGAFPVPEDLATASAASFALSVAGQILELPRPRLDVLDIQVPDLRPHGSWPTSLRRAALAIAIASQLGAPALLPAAAHAGAPVVEAGETESRRPGPPGQPGSEPPSGGEAPAGEPPAPEARAPEGSETQPPHPAEPREPAGTPPGEPQPSEPQGPPPAAPAQPPAAPARSGIGTAYKLRVPSPAKGGAPDGAGTHPTDPPRPHRGSRGSHVHAPHHGRRARPGTHRGQRPGGNDARPGLDAAPLPQPPSPWAPSPELAQLQSILPSILQAGAEDAPPPFLIRIYHAAGRRYGVPWTVLAAINQLESDFGRDLSVSSAGAIGWMQFMPQTWREWAVDADRDGIADPYSPWDAIFTAARYLRASGASRDLPGAIFAYNHATWYVAAVMLRAQAIGKEPVSAPLSRGYSLPLDRRYMSELGRTDDGVDIETAPDGSLLYSITPGTVTAVASDPAGFGPNYPVIEATSGPLAGQHIYYGHVAIALVRPGQHVHAGEPVAIMGHTGDAASLGHGHVEIGFSDAAGVPLDQHGATPATPAGELMRTVLVDLSAAFGIGNG
jgi:murein DD-endopeptidase MepM/ murein hydrolase activator NlpD